MYAFIALAVTLPPSLAFVASVFMRFREERLRNARYEVYAQVDANKLGIEEHEFKLRSLTDRVTEVERNVGMLTDRAMR